MIKKLWGWYIRPYLVNISDFFLGAGVASLVLQTFPGIDDAAELGVFGGSAAALSLAVYVLDRWLRRRLCKRLDAEYEAAAAELHSQPKLRPLEDWGKPFDSEDAWGIDRDIREYEALRANVDNMKRDLGVTSDTKPSEDEA